MKNKTLPEKLIELSSARGVEGRSPRRRPQTAKSPNAFRSSAGGELLSQTARGGSPAIEGFPLELTNFFKFSLVKQPGELFDNELCYIFVNNFSTD